MTRHMALREALTDYTLQRLLNTEDTQFAVFLLADAVACAKHGQKVPQGFYSIELMLKSLIRNGEALACGTCMDARGLAENEIPYGAVRSTMQLPAEHALNADKVLVFQSVSSND